MEYVVLRIWIAPKHFIRDESAKIFLGIIEGVALRK